MAFLSVLGLVADHFSLKASDLPLNLIVTGNVLASRIRRRDAAHLTNLQAALAFRGALFAEVRLGSGTGLQRGAIC